MFDCICAYQAKFPSVRPRLIFQIIMTEAAEFFVFLQSVDGGERPAGFWARVVRAFLANGVSGPFFSCILCNA